MPMLFSLHLDFPTLLGDYLQKVRLMLLLFQVIHLKKQKANPKVKRFADEVLTLLTLGVLAIVLIVEIFTPF